MLEMSTQEVEKPSGRFNVGDFFTMAIMMVVFGVIIIIMLSYIMRIISPLITPAPQTVLFERDSEGRIIAIHYVSAK